MKKNYLEPEYEITKFSTFDDVITTSVEGPLIDPDGEFENPFDD